MKLLIINPLIVLHELQYHSQFYIKTNFYSTLQCSVKIVAN